MELNEQDYKYVIQDFSNIYIGARFTYAQLVENDDTPGRLKDTIYRIFYKEVSPEISVGEHLLSLQENSVCYLAYAQLRLQIKVTCLVQKEDKKGNFKEEYETRDYSLADFMKQEDIRKNPDRYLIQEISFKKRYLMMMHV
jgi:hypothetical protein